MRKLIKIILIAILVTAAASWLTSVAYGHNNDSIRLDGSINEGIRVEAAPLEAAPSITCHGGAIGSVIRGDLFYIDSTNITQDINVNLTITNADELIHYFKYMTLKVVVYYEVGEGQWEKALMTDGGAFPDIYLTAHNGHVNFNLPGLAQYKVSIESGCFNCYPAGTSGGSAAPLFYLEAESI